MRAGLRAGVAALALEDVSSTANAAVANGSLVAGNSAVELLVERDGRLLAGLVDVAGSANAAEVATRGSDGGGRVGGGCLLRLGSTGDVACAAAAGADVGGGRGRGLSDDVAGHFDGVCCGVENCVWLSVGAYGDGGLRWKF